MEKSEAGTVSNEEGIPVPTLYAPISAADVSRFIIQAGEAQAGEPKSDAVKIDGRKKPRSVKQLEHIKNLTERRKHEKGERAEKAKLICLSVREFLKTPEKIEREMQGSLGAFHYGSEGKKVALNWAVEGHDSVCSLAQEAAKGSTTMAAQLKGGRRSHPLYPAKKASVVEKEEDIPFPPAAEPEPEQSEKEDQDGMSSMDEEALAYSAKPLPVPTSHGLMAPRKRGKRRDLQHDQGYSSQGSLFKLTYS